MVGDFGGRADKFGNEFERLWVVRLALKVLHGELQCLRWEPLAPEGRGIDVSSTSTVSWRWTSYSRPAITRTTASWGEDI